MAWLDVNGTNIFWSYSNLIRFGRVFIRQYPILKIFIIHIWILKVVFLWCRYPLQSFFDTNIHYNLIGQKLTLSIYNSIFKQKYEKKYDINNIHPYSICLHLYMTILNTTWRWYYGVRRSFWGGLALVRISKPLWRDNLVQMITYINEHFCYLWIGSRCTIDYAMSTN